mmetsp:Transcript_4519/g.9724  ORF Transcript_4519/g.9724 Transcript_4519/m.9724 type:complete len:220 (-) Transcript_4519:235-894(-)
MLLSTLDNMAPRSPSLGTRLPCSALRLVTIFCNAPTPPASFRCCRSWPFACAAAAAAGDDDGDDGGGDSGGRGAAPSACISLRAVAPSSKPRSTTGPFTTTAPPPNPGTTSLHSSSLLSTSGTSSRQPPPLADTSCTLTPDTRRGEHQPSCSSATSSLPGMRLLAISREACSPTRDEMRAGRPPTMTPVASKHPPSTLAAFPAHDGIFEGLPFASLCEL